MNRIQSPLLNVIQTDTRFAGSSKTPRRLGFALAGLLGITAILPSLASGDRYTPKEPVAAKKAAPRPLLLDDKTLAELNEMRKPGNTKDLRTLETKWSEKNDPMVTEGAAQLYEAEKEDLKALKEGRITADKMRVKTCIAAFVGPGEYADDRDFGPSLHFTKRFDKVGEDKKIYRYQVNERWPIIPETGSIGAANVIRVLVQVKSTDAKDEDSFKTMLSGVYLMDWAFNVDGSYGNARIFPLLYTQNHFSTEFNKDSGFSTPQPTIAPVGNPVSCVSCHSSGSTFTKDNYLKPWQQRTDFRSIVPLSEYEKDPLKQLGARKYLDYLEGRYAKLKIPTEKEAYRKFIDAIKLDLANPEKLRIPHVVKALRDNPRPERIGEGDSSEPRDQKYGITYTRDGTDYLQAGFARHTLLGFGDWWYLKDLEAIPGNYNLEDPP
jgi:hypothetical protein